VISTWGWLNIPTVDDEIAKRIARQIAISLADIGFLSSALPTPTLAAILGAIIAYHPRYRKTTDILEEIEVPKVYIMYAVIGSIIGILVVKYGLIAGFVLFGIGGLMRFRAVLQSASVTDQEIFVTLIGLACGLDLPHVAVLATAFISRVASSAIPERLQETFDTSIDKSLQGAVDWEVD
jgi:hypothetical protein